MTRLLAMPIWIAVQRLLGLALYPIAYALRHSIRTDEVLMRHEQAATCGVVLWKPRQFKALWLLLDDSINAEGQIVYGKDIDYCHYGNRSDLVEKLPDGKFKEFARSWHWSAVRNSCINLTWLLALGDMTSEKILHGSKPRNFVAERTYPGGKKRLYIQFYPWGDFRVKAGFLSNGRFEIQARVKAPA
ncbi:MAG TPA: hypothetical protein VLH09_03450 [Bryobacteraceae bacterium]|nr:hypothetical protein [Bryobacteraceae bacterium]